MDEYIRVLLEGMMERIADRITVIAETIGCRALDAALVACLCFAGASGFAQGPAGSATPPPKPAEPATYSGCVQKAPNSSTDLVISTPKVCARLEGNVSANDLVGHEVELKGVLTPRTSSVAASIQVDSIVRVGTSCSDVCSLKPPSSRGLHRPQDGAVPGSEGGTPGVTARPPQ
jgi:hypothetical protein